MKKEISRRDFIKATTVTGAGFLVAAGNFSKPARASALQNVAVACIGVGGQGKDDFWTANEYGYGKVVALCDVDHKILEEWVERYSGFKGIRTYYDFREMFEEMDGKIDACTISTPDHMHAIITATAMKHGIHTYTQTPLTRTIYEARYLTELAKKNPALCTQTGDTESADDEFRKVTAQLKAGLLGEIKEVHFVYYGSVWWSDYSDWREYFKTKSDNTDDHDSDDVEKKIQIKKALKNLEWDLWLGVASKREYRPEIYHPGSWGGWWDFGTGYMGRIQPASTNLMFRALELKDPISAVATSSGHDNKIFPEEATIEMDFPENKWRGPVKCYWYSDRSRISDVLRKTMERYDFDPASADYDDNYAFILGEKGAGFIGSLYGLSYEFHEEYGGDIPWILENKTKFVIAPKFDSNNRHMYEWLYAIQKGKPELCWSNFANHAGPLCESLLVGNLALWVTHQPDVPGKRIEWDSAGMSVKNLKELRVKGLEELIKPVYQNGYKQLDELG